MNSVGHLATVIIFDLIKIIILANLGIFLELIAAEEAQVHAIPTDSSPKLGVAPNFEGAQWSRALQPAQTIRKQVAVTDGDEQISGFKIDTSNRLANLIDFHTHYTVDGDDTELIGWEGNVASSEEGTNRSSYQDLVLRWINYFRGQAGLPTTVAFDSAKHAAAQQAVGCSFGSPSIPHLIPSISLCMQSLSRPNANHAPLAVSWHCVLILAKNRIQIRYKKIATAATFPSCLTSTDHRFRVLSMNSRFPIHDSNCGALGTGTM
jgi:hypothetical protein